MTKAPQKRTLQTRAKLIQAAETLVNAGGFEAMRVEEVVARAGVAKGTFFAHFRDKDALMELLIGARINACLDEIEKLPPPNNLADLVEGLGPLHRLMIHERYVFDVIIRHSGAVASDDIGAIAETFGRYLDVTSEWLARGPFRKDISPELLAEGLQAFAVQAMALHFCALHQDVSANARLLQYLDAWLLPRSSA